MRSEYVMAGCVLYVILFAEQPVLGYLDPGSGSMFLQLLLGGVAGAAVIGKLYWQRFISFVTRRKGN